MKNIFKRRDFIFRGAAAGTGVALMPVLKGAEGNMPGSIRQPDRDNLKLSLNAYSFDRLLKSGAMTIDDLLEFCSQTGFDGVDLTGYYFQGYPSVPADDIIYRVKRKAFASGLFINNTGVRNDFSSVDPGKRALEKKHVKDWIEVAQKLGAPSLRIFSGTMPDDNYTWKERAQWIAEDIRECADYGRNHGVILAVQNHHDFIKTALEVEELLKIVDHEWVGLMLDIGSYHTADPYKDIEANSKYAITWQMKEMVYFNNTQTSTDYSKIIDIVRKCGYRGCLPLETLGAGDPYLKVKALFSKVSSILNQ
jgi:sugar phosphate isomerase/epimerase